MHHGQVGAAFDFDQHGAGALLIDEVDIVAWGENYHSARGAAGQNQGVPDGFSVGYTGS